MNLVDVKYNGNNNSESIPSTLFLHVVNCSSETISTNKYPSKIFFGCQNVNMKIAQVSDDNLYTVRIWRSCTSHDTHTCFLCYIIIELYHICGNPEEIYRIITYFFIYWLCGKSVLVTTTLGVLTLRMEKRSADMESSGEYIK